MSREISPIGERATGDSEIVSVIDDADGDRTCVIADISRDDAWLSVSATDAATLNEHK